MSLLGRRIIDQLKRSLSSNLHLSLPVPPYESPEYWDQVYSTFHNQQHYHQPPEYRGDKPPEYRGDKGKDKTSEKNCASTSLRVFEWGDIHFHSDLQQFRYVVPPRFQEEVNRYFDFTEDTDQNRHCDQEIDGHFQEAIGVSYPPVSSPLSYSQPNILMLGCGNSRLGEDILQHYLQIQKDTFPSTVAECTHSTTTHANPSIPPIPKVIQCDVSRHVVDQMIQRCQILNIAESQMSILHDDARYLTQIEKNTIDAVVDKGLIDALYCANQGFYIRQIMNTVHNVLKDGSTFVFFTYSEPDYLFHEVWKTQDVASPMEKRANNTTIMSGNNMINKNQDSHEPSSTWIWKHIEIRKLDRILMYRFVKGYENSHDRHLNETTTVDTHDIKVDLIRQETSKKLVAQFMKKKKNMTMKR